MHATVADGMAAYLIASVIGLLADVSVEVVAFQDHAAGLGSIAIRFHEFSPSGTQGAVGVNLHAADGEEVFVNDTLTHEIVHGFVIWIDHGIYMNLQ